MSVDCWEVEFMVRRATRTQLFTCKRSYANLRNGFQVQFSNSFPLNHSYNYLYRSWEKKINMGKRKSSKKPQAKKSMAPLCTSPLLYPFHIEIAKQLNWQTSLASAFKCLFCHHEKAVSVKMWVWADANCWSRVRIADRPSRDKASMFGHLNCKVSCLQNGLLYDRKVEA